MIPVSWMVDEEEDTVICSAALLTYTKKVMSKGVNHLDNCVFVDGSDFNACMVPGRARPRKRKKALVLMKAKRAKNILITDIPKFTDKLLQGLDEQCPKYPFFTAMNNASFHNAPFITESSKILNKLYLLPPYWPMYPKQAGSKMLQSSQESENEAMPKDCYGWVKHYMSNLTKCLKELFLMI
ncbi:hypothetical protein BDF20DRAFT_839579 [Mycotypha africana]|uniref:uncharacterized protein n=1 Tax=Mycotypha africana TaxID=64632 RepID=UPI002301136C|nr:uncharacterized protein BDF20DRAFT_839579 [Mycotypha africana]KAI8968474.1 hypothetical protein BDF20DRAFT_839579 [Mycotypha africana]